MKALLFMTFIMKFLLEVTLTAEIIAQNKKRDTMFKYWKWLGENCKVILVQIKSDNFDNLDFKRNLCSHFVLNRDICEVLHNFIERKLEITTF